MILLPFVQPVFGVKSVPSSEEWTMIVMLALMPAALIKVKKWPGPDGRVAGHVIHRFNARGPMPDLDQQALRPVLRITFHECLPPWGNRNTRGFKDYSALTRVDQNQMETLIADAGEVAYRERQLLVSSTKNEAAIPVLINAKGLASNTGVFARPA